jgi:hypothetical protein
VFQLDKNKLLEWLEKEAKDMRSYVESLLYTRLISKIKAGIFDEGYPWGKGVIDDLIAYSSQDAKYNTGTALLIKNEKEKGASKMRKWYNGKVVKLIEKRFHYSTVEGKFDGVHAVPNSYLEDYCEDAFKIGDKVSNPKGFFEGVVTGFEPKENRVVCLSEYDKSGKTRKRYAYKPHEIEKFDPDSFTFELGKDYYIDGVEVKACEDALHRDRVHFYKMNGELFKQGVFKKNNIRALKNVLGWNRVKKA